MLRARERRLYSVGDSVLFCSVDSFISLSLKGITCGSVLLERMFGVEFVCICCSRGCSSDDELLKTGCCGVIC